MGSLDNVVLAGASFLVLAAFLIPFGATLHSAVIMAYGMDSANDGVFFFIGGIASLWFSRNHRHWVNCYARESIEGLAMLFGVGSYWLGIILVASTGAGLHQMVVGLIFGPIGMAVNWYWHGRVEADDADHEGFTWHLLANLAGAAAMIPCGIFAFVFAAPSVNLWGAYVVLIATAAMCIGPGWKVLVRVWHRPSDHENEVDP